MFATSGYFKGVDCPYFQSGLCERPYCHFRHVKKDDGRDASSGYISGSRPSSPLDSALGQCSGPTGSKPVGSGSYLTKTGPTGSVSGPNVPASSSKFVEEYCVDEEAASDGPAYEPTPKYEVAGKTKRKISTDCLYQPGGPAVEVPEYEPNPIPGSKPGPKAEYKPGSVPKFSSAAQERYVPDTKKKVSKPHAKKRRANPPEVPEVIPEYVPSAVAQYNPTPINQLKKMKKNAETDLEYDPVNNYMCNANPAQEDVGEVLYVPTKRPKIEEDNDGADDNMCVDLDEFGDSDDAKFSSDEELDKSELIMDSGRYESPLEEDSDDEEVSEIFAVKPFFRDTSADKSSVCTKASEKTDICENELKHPVRKPVSQKTESDKISPEKSKKCKSEQSDKSKGKVRDKSDKSSKHSSQSSSHKSSSKDSNGKSSDSSLRRDTSYSRSSHGNKTNKSSDHSKNKSTHSSSKSSEKKTDNSSSSASHSKHSDKSKHKDSENDKHKDSSSKTEKDNSKSSSAEKKHKSHSGSQSRNRSSSKDSSHRKEHRRDSKEKLKESENKKSRDGHSKSSSSSHGHSHSNKDGHSAHKSSSSSSNGHSHLSKSGSKSEKENKNKHEKSKSSSSKSCKEKSSGKEEVKDVARINVDLFGSESEDEESLANKSQEMSELELAKFLEDSDFESDNDTFEECLKIFNEDAASFKKVKSEKQLQKDVGHSKNNETATIPSKKRVAHANDSRPSKSTAPRVPVKMSPAQVMHNRLVEMQRRALEAAEARKAIADAHAATSASSSTAGSSQKRQAHLPRSRSTGSKSLCDRDEDKRTVAITVSRGQRRTAHAPTISNVKRPTIPAEFGGKVPSNIRQRYLNLIIDECLKICKTEEEAYKKGQEEETAVYKRATNKNIYLRVAVNAIKRLRVEVEQACPSPTKSSPNKIVKQSHEAMLGGKNATKTTYTLHRSGGGNKTQTDDFRGADLYQRLSKYIMTEDQLKENGYPRPSPEGGSTAVFYKYRNEKDVILKAHEKNCVRCGKRFIVFPNGNYNREEECIYHWGKAWKKRVDRALVTSYNCCGGDLEAEGCQVCKFHVYESNKAENVTGYMKTIPSSPPIDGDYGVYAMDCEMVYTKGGMELARVTVIDPDSKPVYESIVKPDFPVIDYNTRFSGLTEADLKGVKTTLRDVQAVLLSLFTDKTILMGHSLESDLISVKLIHNTVVDTSIVFPHRLGLPYKRALRNLMVDFLQKIIQDDVGGHDSQEDALACLQLMQWKLKEDAKKEIRRV